MINVIKSLVLLLVIVGLYASFVEYNWVNVNHYKIQNSKVKIPFKIVLISDLHATNRPRFYNYVMDKISEENPNLLLFAGDAYSGEENFKYARSFFEEINKRFSKIYKYAVPGTIDQKHLVDLSFFYKTVGFRMLVNRYEIVKIANARDSTDIYMIGFNDYYSGKTDESLSNAMISRLDPNFLTIALSHSPEIMNYFSTISPDLILAGGTHGKQFDLPLADYLWGPLMYNDFSSEKVFKYKKGQYVVGKTNMIVDSGLGTSIVPARLISNPTISVIEF